MKIGYYVSQYPRMDEPPGYFWGGTGVAAAGLAEAIASLGHEVTVLTSSPSNKQSTRDQNGVTVVERASWVNISQASIAPSLLWAGLRFEFDLVHAHAGNPPAPFGALTYHYVKDVPLVVTYHGDPQAGYGSRARRFAVRSYQGVLLSHLLRTADALFVPSLGFLDDSHNLRDIGRTVLELPNGIVCQPAPREHSKSEARVKLGIPEHAHVTLFLGSLNPYKGPDVLLEASVQLLKRDPAAIVVYVGDGLLREPLEKRAIELGMGRAIRFYGFVPEREKRLYFDASDILALPSTMSSEVFPFTVLEAFASGRPVIVSDLATFSRYVRHAENGIVVPRGSVSALSRALISILGDGETLRRLGVNALASARTFDWAHIAGLAERTYLELVRA